MLDNTSEKFCNSCKQWLTLDLFGKDKHSKSGYTDYCRQCRNRHLRERASKRPEIYKIRNEKYKEQRKAYYSRPEVVERGRNQHLIKKFGITLADYNQMLSEQNGLCKICKKPGKAKRIDRLTVDHCHKTGVIRGLLCGNCNRAIGLLGENTETLKSAINFLEKAKC